MNLATRLILGGIGTGIAVSAGVIAFTPNEPTITLNNPQKIQWNKPTTDEGWAEDVKAESFHIKSTGKLQEMREAHANKLERYIKGKREELECEECLRFKLRQRFEEQGLTGDDLELSIENEYQNEIAHAQWKIEKLTQSVERMDKELELREKGFVVVEGEVKEGFLGRSVPPERIRYIND